MIRKLFEEKVDIKEIQEKLFRLCGKFPKRQASLCTQILEKHLKQIIEILTTEPKASRICAQIGVCRRTRIPIPDLKERLPGLNPEKEIQKPVEEVSNAAPKFENEKTSSWSIAWQEPLTL